jgi:hypothetical protein
MTDDVSEDEGTEGLPPEQQDDSVFRKDPAKGRGFVGPYVGTSDAASPADYDDAEDDR